MIRHADFASRYVVPRHVDVWLPPEYEAAPARRFPVLYMHDGQNLSNPAETNFGVDWGVDETLKRLVAAGEVPPTIVVGVWNTSQRTPEYLPNRPFAGAPPELAQPLLDEQGEPLGDKYLAFLVSELKPFIDAHYRTLPARETTTIVGSSRGGLISLYAICEYPDVFQGAGCISTHWPAVEGIIAPYLAKRLPAPESHRIYFDYGTETLDALYEPLQQVVDPLMVAAGYEHGRNWVTLKFPGTEHSERAWRERVHIPLRFLLGHLVEKGT